MRRTIVMGGVLAAALLAACGDSTPAPTPVIDASGTALEPLAPDPAFERAAADLCVSRADVDSEALTLDFQDRRTPDVAYLEFSDSDKRVGCLLVSEGADSFRVEVIDTGSLFNAISSDLGISSFSRFGGPSGPSGMLVSGRVPDGVATVWIERADGSRVRASAANGWFTAWWLGDVIPELVVGLDDGGREFRREPIDREFFQ